MEFIVEPALRAHFTIPHPSPDYEQMLARAPDVFVGGSCRLAPLVQLLCALMADSFERQGLALPPWRKEAAMLSKWLPAPSRTRDVPVVARAHSATAVDLPLPAVSTLPFDLPTFNSTSGCTAAAAAPAPASRGPAFAAQPIHVSALTPHAVFGFGIGGGIGSIAAATTGAGNIESGSCCGGIDSGYGIASDASALLLGFGLGGSHADAMLDSAAGIAGYSCGAGAGGGKDCEGVFSLGCSPDGELPMQLPPAMLGHSSRRSLRRPAVHLGFEPCAPAPAAAAAALSVSVWGGSPPAPGGAARSCGSCSGSSSNNNSFGGRGTGLLSAKLQRSAAAAAAAAPAAGPASGQQQQPQQQQPQQQQQQPQRIIETRPPAYQGGMCIRVVKLVGFNVPPPPPAAANSIAAAAQAPAQRA